MPTLSHPRSTMKKSLNAKNTPNEDSVQEKIIEFTDDLTMALDSYINDLTTEQLFSTALKYLTFTLYECTQNHKKAYGLLTEAIDEGIQMYMDKRNH